ncbi:MAG: MBL fold metallo-hydrolase [Candidatus Competibacteraceae bacterium]
MKPLFQTYLVNNSFEDPVLYLDFLFENRALLFDLGNLRALPTRKLLRVSHLFVSHTHMDHFADFDWLLRICLGRCKYLHLFGPAGFIDRVEHKLGAYTWNLVQNYETDFVLVVTELHPDESGRRAEFRLRQAFARDNEQTLDLPGNVLVDETAFQVRAVVLDHGGIPCLGFAVHEKQHVNLWKNRLEALQLPVGPWLRELKQAVLSGQPDDFSIRAWWREQGIVRERYLPLGELKAQVVRLAPGQKIGYIVDVGYRPENARRIIELVRQAHSLFIEAVFLQEDAALATAKSHLTAHQAGLLARAAQVQRLCPIHFSPRYTDREQELRQEAQLAFTVPSTGGEGA